MKRRSVYSPHPGLAMVQNSMRLLEERTGRTAQAWAKLADRDGPAGASARRDWLKKEHGLTTNYAMWIANMSLGEGLADMDAAAYLEAAEGYVDAMFAGRRAGLKPTYDHLLETALALGPDVKACPGKTAVPLYREHVFAQIKPSTNTRIDLGLALGDLPATPPLIDTGGFAKKDRITHRIPVSSPAEVDATVKRWLRKAYDRDR
jgi:hypothetical protein